MGDSKFRTQECEGVGGMSVSRRVSKIWPHWSMFFFFSFFPHLWCFWRQLVCWKLDDVVVALCCNQVIPRNVRDDGCVSDTRPRSHLQPGLCRRIFVGILLLIKSDESPMRINNFEIKGKKNAWRFFSIFFLPSRFIVSCWSHPSLLQLPNLFHHILQGWNKMIILGWNRKLKMRKARLKTGTMKWITIP